MSRVQITTHLEALRLCIIRSLIGFAICFLLSLIFISKIFALLSFPYRRCLQLAGAPIAGSLRSLGPSDALSLTFKAALLFGLGLASPWIIYQISRFVGPALHRHEKKYVIPFCTSVLVFFLGGASFAYFIALPSALTFFYTYTIDIGFIPDWAISNYYDFLIAFVTGFGFVFELPIVIVVLTALKLITPVTLSTYRRHAIVIIFIAAGILTPGPDVASQLMMGIPMLILYELSIIASKIIFRRREEVQEPTDTDEVLG